MKNILVVDDNPDIAETVKLVVEKEGFKPIVVYNGEQLLETIPKYSVSLILLDVMMPGLNTKQILEGLKEKGEEKTPVILVTAVRFSEKEIEALKQKYSVKDYITKPFDIVELGDAIKKHIA